MQKNVHTLACCFRRRKSAACWSARRLQPRADRNPSRAEPLSSRNAGGQKARREQGGSAATRRRWFTSGLAPVGDRNRSRIVVRTIMICAGTDRAACPVARSENHVPLLSACRDHVGQGVEIDVLDRARIESADGNRGSNRKRARHYSTNPRGRAPCTSGVEEPLLIARMWHRGQPGKASGRSATRSRQGSFSPNQERLKRIVVNRLRVPGPEHRRTGALSRAKSSGGAAQVRCAVSCGGEMVKRSPFFVIPAPADSRSSMRTVGAKSLLQNRPLRRSQAGVPAHVRSRTDDR